MDSSGVSKALTFTSDPNANHDDSEARLKIQSSLHINDNHQCNRGCEGKADIGFEGGDILKVEFMILSTCLTS